MAYRIIQIDYHPTLRGSSRRLRLKCLYNREHLRLSSFQSACSTYLFSYVTALSTKDRLGPRRAIKTTRSAKRSRRCPPNKKTPFCFSEALLIRPIHQKIFKRKLQPSPAQRASCGPEMKIMREIALDAPSTF